MFTNDAINSFYEKPEDAPAERDKLFLKLAETSEPAKRSNFLAKIFQIVDIKNLKKLAEHNNNQFLKELAFGDIRFVFSILSELRISIINFTPEDDTALHVKLIQDILTKKTINHREYFSSDKISIRNKLFILDHQSLSGDAPDLLNHYLQRGVKISQNDLLYAMSQNHERRNVKTLTKIMSNRNLFSVDSVAVQYAYRLLETYNSQPFKVAARKLVEKKATKNLRQNLKNEVEYLKTNVREQDGALLKRLFFNELDDVEFYTKIVESVDPKIFKLLLQTLVNQSRYDEVEQLCRDRYAYYPNSLNASNALTYVYERNKQQGLAIKLQQRINNAIWNEGCSSRLSRLRATLGDWKSYEREFEYELRNGHIFGAYLPAVANTHALFMDAAPNLPFEQKVKMLHHSSDTKDVRVKLPAPKRSKSKVALFSGDIRRHAMFPYVELMIDTLNSCDEIDLTTYSLAPIRVEDKNTKMIDDKYGVHKISNFSDQELEVIRREQFDIAIDMNLQTEFSGQLYFQAGCAERQFSTQWSMGFASGNRFYDAILCDHYSLDSVVDQSLLSERKIGVHNAMCVPAVQDVSRAKTYNPSQVKFGIFCRPMRYSPQLFERIRELISFNRDFEVKLSHPALASEGTQAYIYDLLSAHGIHQSSVELDERPFVKAIKDVDVVIDGVPINSPTVTKDLIYSGIPVLAYSGANNPFTRMSASYLKSLQLDYLVYENPREFMQKLEDIDTIVDRFLKTDIRDNFERAYANFRTSLRTQILANL